MSDELYADFCSFLKERNLSYNTVTERVVKELREVARQEKYDSAIDESLKAMEAALEREKEGDLQKHSDEIREMLKAELLTRYYFDQGRIEGALKSDPVVARAVQELLNK